MFPAIQHDFGDLFDESRGPQKTTVSGYKLQTFHERLDFHTRVLTEVEFKWMDNSSVYNCAGHAVSDPVSLLSSHWEESGMVAFLYDNKGHRWIVFGVQCVTGGCSMKERKWTKERESEHKM